MLRKARISWDAIPNATSYTVEATGNVKYEKDDQNRIVKHVRTVQEIGITNTYYDINLDEYLAESTADTFKVKAVSSSAFYSDSEYSTAIKIVDNPIIRADGDNSDAADDAETGDAEIKWERTTGALKYSIRYREVTGDDDASTWRANNFGSALTAHPQGLTTHTIPGLGKIYALQMNYELNGQKVFSGRDMFVWPSDGFTAEDERVATYPYFAHWPNKEYRYRICETSFPSEHRIKWGNLINHALEQWETATDGLITVTRDTSTTCSFVDRAIGLLLRQYPVLSGALHINDVYMVDDATLLDCNVVCQYRRQAYFSNLLGDVQAVCVFNAPACTISKAYGEDAQASTSLSNASGSTDGVDILFRKSEFEDKSIEIPHSVTFNKCFPRSFDYKLRDLDGTRHFAYTTALHEAGHALGTSGAVIWEALLEDAQYRRAHPSIPDAVMNYDEKIPENYNPNIASSREGDNADKWLRYEANCYPNPFDILAIYALYQHVDDSSDE